jgi:CheY-like chemotaxis protein/two-component sensor histidine kinase
VASTYSSAALLAEAKDATTRISELVAAVRSYSQLDRASLQSIDVTEGIESTLVMLGHKLRGGVDVVRDYDPELGSIEALPGELNQVWTNLIDNAIDAMAGNGTLRIATRSDGDCIVVEIADTGAGMPAEVQRRAFDPFFTTKDVGRGTGLGLATVYGIVKQMGGLIRVTSEPGRGATFRVYLPETRQRVQPEAAPAPSPPPRGDETLLLVEDDGAVRTFLVRALERHGYRVLSADHPSVALGLVQSFAEPIDLLITDVVLPGQVGPEFVRALAELRGARPPLPVLYISGYADGSPVWRGDVPKASHFLQKPFTAAELLTRIRQILPAVRPPGSSEGHAV